MSTKDDIERIKKMREELNYNSDKSNAESWVGRTSHQVQYLQKFFISVGRVAVWLWWNFGNPVLNKVTMPVILFFIGWYIKIWNRYTFPKDKFGVEHFSMIRGSKLLVGTIIAAFLSWNMLFLTYDATLFVLPWTSQHGEQVYLFGSTDNSFNDDNWSVTGCEIKPSATKFSCNNDGTLYYRVQPNLFNYIWHISWNGWNPFAWFLPEVVTAPVAAGWNICKVTSYGIRWKLFVRQFQQYVNLIATDCEPIVVNNVASPSEVTD